MRTCTFAVQRRGRAPYAPAVSLVFLLVISGAISNQNRWNSGRPNTGAVRRNGAAQREEADYAALLISNRYHHAVLFISWFMSRGRSWCHGTCRDLTAAMSVVRVHLGLLAYSYDSERELWS